MARLTDSETLREIIKDQNQVANAQYLDSRGNRLWIGASSNAALEGRALRDGGSIEKIPQFKDDEANLYYNRDGSVEVWVSPGFANYVGAFAAMLRIVYDYDFKNAELSGINIDHIYARSAAQASRLRWVRLAAIDEKVNKGRGNFEKRLGPPLNAVGLARATVVDLCKINNCPLLLGSPGLESAGVAMMVAWGVQWGFIPRDKAAALIVRGQREIAGAFSP